MSATTEPLPRGWCTGAHGPDAKGCPNDDAFCPAFAPLVAARSVVDRDKCLTCGHHRFLHAPIGATEQQPGAKCAVCQCAGLELQRSGEDNSADERAEGGA